MSALVENLPGMIGRHPKMLELYELVRLAAQTDLPSLVVGETGTGKELVAQALHQLSPRAPRPFISVNCAAIPESLAEAEFFGVERGAFTGADRARAGRVELADSGTLFLDEICSAPLTLQAKLLRTIETGEFWPVGGRVSAVFGVSGHRRNVRASGTPRIDGASPRGSCVPARGGRGAAAPAVRSTERHPGAGWTLCPPRQWQRATRNRSA